MLRREGTGSSEREEQGLFFRLGTWERPLGASHLGSVGKSILAEGTALARAQKYEYCVLCLGKSEIPPKATE